MMRLRLTERRVRKVMQKMDRQRARRAAQPAVTTRPAATVDPVLLAEARRLIAAEYGWKV